MPLSSQLERQIFDWSFQHNLQLIVQYHNFIRSKLHHHYQELADEESEREVLRRYDWLNANNCFLMAYAHLEELLYSIWRAIAPSATLQRGSSVKRFKSALREAGVDLEHSEAWMFIQDASRVRDCLLHANGRISHVTQGKEDLQQCLRRRGELHVSGDRVSVSPEFLRRFVNEVGNLRREAVRV